MPSPTNTNLRDSCANQRIDREGWQRPGGIYPAGPSQLAHLSSPLYGWLLPDGILLARPAIRVNVSLSAGY